MKETSFQLILLNPTLGISTPFNIKWKFKSYPCHSTNEDHVKENRKWGIIIIQWKNFSNMDRKVHKPEIRPQEKKIFFFSFNKVLCLVPGCKEDQDEISALSELSSVTLRATLFSWVHTGSGGSDTKQETLGSECSGLFLASPRGKRVLHCLFCGRG